MVQTITPVVHGGRARWGRSVALHTLGATISAAALGAALGGIGAALGAPWGRLGFLFVAVVAGVYAARELLRAPVPLPNLHRQVPEWWRTFFSPAASSFLYGLGLGVGFVTYLSFGTLVAVAAVAVASGSPLVGLLVVAPFGLARGLSVLVAAPATGAERVGLVVDRLDRLALSRVPRRANGFALASIAVAAAVAAVGADPLSGTGVAAPLLGAVFAAAAGAKLVRWQVWTRTLQSYRLGPFESVTRILVPAAELGVAGLVLAGEQRAAGLLALALLAAFSVAIVRAAAGKERLACGCFGRARAKKPEVLVGRNVLLMGLAVLTAAGPATSSVRLGLPSGQELVPAGLALLGAMLVLGLLRATLDLARPRHRD